LDHARLKKVGLVDILNGRGILAGTRRECFEADWTAAVTLDHHAQQGSVDSI
jgi:hypothetical protein